MIRVLALSLLLALPLRADEVVLSWSVVETHTPDPNAETRGPKPPAKVERTLVASLRADRLCVRDGAQWWVLELKAERVRTIDLAKRQFTEHPLIADVHMRDAELLNRLRLAGALGGAIGKRNPITRYDSEALLGIEAHGQAPLTVARTDGVFRHGDREVARLVAGQTARPAWATRPFGQLLLFRSSLHPRIRAALLAMPNWPASLRWTVRTPAGTKTSRWTLDSVATPETPTTPPATADLTRTRRLPDGLKATLALLAGKRVTPPTLVAVDAAARAALDAGRTLDAVLAYLDYSLATSDPQASARIRALGPRIQGDARCQTFFGSLQPRTADQARQALKVLRGIDRTGMSYGHVIDLMIAPFHLGLREPTKAEPLYLKVLTAHPHLTAAWNDLGMIYARGYRMVAAWACWQRARAIAPKHNILKPIAELEQRLRAQRAECFAARR